jgi:hypothetical protein
MHTKLALVITLVMGMCECDHYTRQSIQDSGSKESIIVCIDCVKPGAITLTTQPSDRKNDQWWCESRVLVRNHIHAKNVDVEFDPKDTRNWAMFCVPSEESR